MLNSNTVSNDTGKILIDASCLLSATSTIYLIYTENSPFKLPHELMRHFYTTLVGLKILTET